MADSDMDARGALTDGGRVRISLLGNMAISVAGRSVRPPSADKSCAMLAYLVMEARAVPRDELAGLFWPNVASSNARQSLRVALNALRKVLDERLVSDRHAVELVLTPEDTVDVRTLELAANSSDPREWGRSAEIIPTGSLASRLRLDLPEYGAWFERVERRLADQARSVLLRLATLSAGEASAETVRLVRLAIALDPLHEPTRRELILALARSGEHGAALVELDTLCDVIATEFGADPEPETLELRQWIVAARKRREFATHSVPRPTTEFVGRAEELAELGYWLAGWRGSDASATAGLPDRSSELEPGDATRLMTIVGPGGIGKTRLAIETARRNERRFLDGVCFVSLAGLQPGGLIDPSVAAELGLEPVDGIPLRDQIVRSLQERELLLVLDNFEHVTAHTLFCAAVLEGAPHVRVLVTSRESLGLPMERVLPVAGLRYPRGAHAAETVQEYGAIALFVAAARRIAPDFDPIPTLGDISEVCWLLEGMPLAIELAASWMDEADCAAIVERLRVDLDALPVPGGLPVRHAGLDAVLEHTWQLLDGTARIAFAKLCIFRGGFDAEASMAVAGVSETGLEVLMRKSLVRPVAQARFDIHEFLRAAGIKRLDAAEALAAQVRADHSHYYLERLAQIAGGSSSVGHTVRDVFDGDGDNVAAAWREAVVRADRALVASVALHLTEHYRAQGPAGLGMECCNDAVGVLAPAGGHTPPGPDSDPAAEFRADADQGGSTSPSVPARRTVKNAEDIALAGRLLAERAEFEHRSGGLEVAEISVSEALETLESLGPDPSAWPPAGRAAAAAAFKLRGVLHRTGGRLDEAVADLDRAHEHALASGDRGLVAEAAYQRAGVEAYRGRIAKCIAESAAVLHSIEGRGLDRLACAITFTLTALHDRLGDSRQAADAARRCLALARSAGYHLGVTNAHAAIGLVKYRAGEFAEALDHQEQAIQGALDNGHHIAERNARLGLAVTLIDLGHGAEALHHIERVRTQAEADGQLRPIAFAMALRASAERRTHAIADALSTAESALAAFQSVDDLSGMAMARSELGMALARAGSAEARSAAEELDRAIDELRAVGDAGMAMTASLFRARFNPGGASPEERLEAVRSIVTEATAAGVRDLLPMADLIRGRIVLPTAPAEAAAAFSAARDGFVALGQAHLAPEAVAGLLLCPGGLDAGSSAIGEALEATPLLLRFRLFGIEDPAFVLDAFGPALVTAGDSRAATVEQLGRALMVGAAVYNVV